MTGSVTLVGAGPGDLGLITLKAYDTIKTAEVVVYDRLVGSDILALIPKTAEKIDAGKESANHKIPQYAINELLLKKAKEGKRVVRLKGGDPFLFGRGGEELELLAKEGIDFCVVPGITSALSVPAYGGIPVTHRDFVSSVHIYTGHRRNNEDLSIDFKSCVNCGGTLVFLMGVSNLGAIVSGLVSEGMNEDMPCAVIENGTRPEQRKIISTLSLIEEKCKNLNIKSPAVIVVGKVCQLGSSFNWFEKLPLKGKKIVVTRPIERIGTLSSKLRAYGAKVIECPCIKTEPINIDMNLLYENIKEYDTIVFTSPKGVKTVFDFIVTKGYDARILGGKKVGAIGSATARELKGYGIIADYVPESFYGKSLGRLLKEKSSGKKILLLRAQTGGKDIIDELESANIEYKDMAVYKTLYGNFSDITSLDNVDYVTFTSASTVKGFVSAFGSDNLSFKAIAIGAKTAEEAKKYNIDTIVSQKAEIDAMLDALVKEAIGCGDS